MVPMTVNFSVVTASILWRICLQLHPRCVVLGRAPVYGTYVCGISMLENFCPIESEVVALQDSQH